MARSAILCALLALSITSARAGDWPQWRGPFHTGAADETGLPSTWSAAENVLWSAALPGPSAATPVTAGDRVFVSSLDAGTKDLLALCLSVKDGKILWQRKVGAETLSAPSNNMASPSPATDGKRVCFLYGTGDVAAFDLRGKPLWSRRLGEEHGRFSLMFGYSSSPLLFDGKLYVQVLRCKTPYRWSGRGEWPTDSFLLALDAATGKTLWKRDRDLGARAESQDAYTSPVLHREGQRALVLAAGGDFVTAHDPATGEEAWRFSYSPQRRDNWRLIPSPVPGDGLVYAVIPRGRDLLYAIPGGRKGEIPWADRVWEFPRETPDVAVPLLYQGRLYVLGDSSRSLTCLDPKSGRVIWRGDLPGGVYRASPTGADGKVYCINESGVATVVAAGDRFEILSRVEMGEGPVRASIAAAAGRLFIRTAKALWCVGK